MALTLLQLIDKVSGELGLTQPTSVIGSSTQQTKQFLALAQGLGEDLVAEFEWARLTKNYVFQTIRASTYVGSPQAGSKVVNATFSAGLLTGAPHGYLSGPGLPANAQIVSAVDNGGANFDFTLDMAATSTETSVTLTQTFQYFAIPDDYDRMIADTNYDRTDNWQNTGSISAQRQANLLGGIISSAPAYQFDLASVNYADSVSSNRRVRAYPAPSSTLNFSYSYVSGYWVIAVSGSTTFTPKATYTLDTDICVFPDNLMRAGLKYYWLNAKKLECGVELATFNDILSTRKAQDVPLGAKSLSPRPQPMFVGNIAEGSWDLGQ